MRKFQMSVKPPRIKKYVRKLPWYKEVTIALVVGDIPHKTRFATVFTVRCAPSQQVVGVTIDKIHLINAFSVNDLLLHEIHEGRFALLEDIK